MAAGHRLQGTFQALPLTPATWSDVEQLASLPGGSIMRGCWCMYYRKRVRAGDEAGRRGRCALG
jgi:hypothetical protein